MVTANQAVFHWLRHRPFVFRQVCHIGLGFALWFGAWFPGRPPVDPVLAKPFVLLGFGLLLGLFLFSAIAALAAWLLLTGTGGQGLDDNLITLGLGLVALAWRSGRRAYARRC